MKYKLYVQPDKDEFAKPQHIGAKEEPKLLTEQCPDCDRGRKYYAYGTSEGVICKRCNGSGMIVKQPENEFTKLLTDHAKYCRLSKQPGGLCAIRKGLDEVVDGCGYKFQHTEPIKEDWTICPRPKKQQPVELPKDPLEDLIADTYLAIDGINSKESTCDILRDFAERVRAL